MKKFERDRLHSIIKCHVIDNLIIEILDDGKKEYEDLSYIKKTALCKLMERKQSLYGKIMA